MFLVRVLLISVFVITPAQAQRVDAEYGVVTKVTKLNTSPQPGLVTIAASGGLLGGLLGATSSKNTTSGDKRRRSLLYGAGGALIGAALGTAMNKNTGAHRYHVDLLDGRSVNITTGQGDVDKGDCVFVETDQTTTIRPVEQRYCNAL